MKAYLNYKTGTDIDVTNFLNATGITDSTQVSAITTLVASLKSSNVWQKLTAIYPFVGGTATTHSFNLKEPRASINAFQLTFFGTWTHSADGALPNGTNAYAKTRMRYNDIPNHDVSKHVSMYINNVTTPNANNVLIGWNTDPGSGWRLMFTTTQIIGANSQGNTGIVVTASDFLGQVIFTHDTSEAKLYQDGAEIGTSGGYTRANPRMDIILGAAMQGDQAMSGDHAVGPQNQWSKMRMAFATVGSHLSASEALALSNAVEAFQVTLGRNA